MSNNRKEIFLQTNNNHKSFLYIWDYVKSPIGIVHIFHGMAEHSGRYNDFARYLNKMGYIVLSADHRGHGKTASDNGLGYIGDNGFNNIVEDKKFISDFIKGEYKDLPLYILGHSFGSFIAQEYLIRYSDKIDGIIFSGSAKNDGIDVKLGSIVSSLQSRIFDDKKKAKFIDKLAFGGFNRKIKNSKTKFDWLTRDEDQVRLYSEDKHCSFIPSINFYNNLFSGLNNLYRIQRLKSINKGIPILVISGDKDPVGKEGKSVVRLYNQYKDIGIEDVEIKLYENGRHELLNEINKDEVYNYIFNWMLIKSFR